MDDDEKLINGCLQDFFQGATIPYEVEDGGSLSGVAFEPVAQSENTKNHGSATLGVPTRNMTFLAENRSTPREITEKSSVAMAEHRVSAEFVESNGEADFYSTLYDGQEAKDGQLGEQQGDAACSPSCTPSLGGMLENDDPAESFSVNEKRKNDMYEIDVTDEALDSPHDFDNLQAVVTEEQCFPQFSVSSEQFSIFEMSNTTNNFDFSQLIDNISSTTDSKTAVVPGKPRKNVARSCSYASVSGIVAEISKLHLSKPLDEHKQRKHSGPRTSGKHSRGKVKHGSKPKISNAEDFDIPKLHPVREVKNMVPRENPPELVPETDTTATPPTLTKTSKKTSSTLASPAGDEQKKKVATLDAVPEIPENHLTNKSPKPAVQDQPLVCCCGSANVCLVHHSLHIIETTRPTKTWKRTSSQSFNSRPHTGNRPSIKANHSDKHTVLERKKSTSEVKCEVVTSQTSVPTPVIINQMSISEENKKTSTTLSGENECDLKTMAPDSDDILPSTMPRRKTAASKNTAPNSTASAVQKSGNKATIKASVKAALVAEHSPPNVSLQIDNKISSSKAPLNKLSKVFRGLISKEENRRSAKPVQNVDKLPETSGSPSSNSHVAHEISDCVTKPFDSLDVGPSAEVASQQSPIDARASYPSLEVVSAVSDKVVQNENIDLLIAGGLLDLSIGTNYSQENSIPRTQSKLLVELPNRTEATTTGQEPDISCDSSQNVDTVPNLSNITVAKSSKKNVSSESPCIPLANYLGQDEIGKCSPDESPEPQLAKKSEMDKEAMVDQQPEKGSNEPVLTKPLSRLEALEKRMRTCSTANDCQGTVIPNSPDKTSKPVQNQPSPKSIHSSPKKTDLKIVVSLPVAVSQIAKTEPDLHLTCGKPKKYRCWTGTSKSLSLQKTKTTEANELADDKTSNTPGADDTCSVDSVFSSLSDRAVTNSALSGSFLEENIDLDVGEKLAPNKITNAGSDLIIEPDVSTKSSVLVNKAPLSVGSVMVNLEEDTPKIKCDDLPPILNMPDKENVVQSSEEDGKLSPAQPTSNGTEHLPYAAYERETTQVPTEYPTDIEPLVSTEHTRSANRSRAEGNPSVSRKSESSVSESSTIRLCTPMGTDCSVKSHPHDSDAESIETDLRSSQNTLSYDLTKNIPVADSSVEPRITRSKLTKAQQKMISTKVKMRTTKIVLMAESRHEKVVKSKSLALESEDRTGKNKISPCQHPEKWQDNSNSSDLTSALKDNIVNESKAIKSAAQEENAPITPRKYSVFDFTLDDDICGPVTTYQSHKDSEASEKPFQEPSKTERNKNVISTGEKKRKSTFAYNRCKQKKGTRGHARTTIIRKQQSIPTARALRSKRKSGEVVVEPVSSDDSEAEAIKSYNREMPFKDSKSKNLDKADLGIDALVIGERPIDKSGVKTRSSLRNSDQNSCRDDQSEDCSTTTYRTQPVQPKLQADVFPCGKLPPASNKQGVAVQVVCPTQDKTGALMGSKSQTNAPKTSKNSALPTNTKVNNEHSLIMDNPMDAAVSLITPRMKSRVAQHAMLDDPAVSDEMHEAPQDAEPEGAKGSSPKCNDHLNNDSSVFIEEPIKKPCGNGRAFHNNHVLRSKPVLNKTITNHKGNLRASSEDTAQNSITNAVKQPSECKSYVSRRNKIGDGTPKKDEVQHSVNSICETTNNESHKDTPKRFTRSLISSQSPCFLESSLLVQTSGAAVKSSLKNYSNPKKKRNPSNCEIADQGVIKDIGAERSPHNSTNCGDVVKNELILSKEVGSPALHRSSKAKVVKERSEEDHSSPELSITALDYTTNSLPHLNASSSVDDPSNEKSEKVDHPVLRDDAPIKTSTKAVCTLSGPAEKLMEEISKEEILHNYLPSNDQVDQVSLTTGDLLSQPKEGNDKIRLESVIGHNAGKQKDVELVGESGSTDTTPITNVDSSMTMISSDNDLISDSLGTSPQEPQVGVESSEPEAVSLNSIGKHGQVALETSSGLIPANTEEPIGKTIEDANSQGDAGCRLGLTCSSASSNQKDILTTMRKSESNCIILPPKRRRLLELRKLNAKEPSTPLNVQQSTNPISIIAYPVGPGADSNIQPSANRMVTASRPSCQAGEAGILSLTKGCEDSSAKKTGKPLNGQLPSTSDHSIIHILKAEQRGYSRHKNSVPSVAYSSCLENRAGRTAATSQKQQNSHTQTRRSSDATPAVIVREWSLWTNGPTSETFVNERTPIHVNTTFEEEPPSPAYSPDPPNRNRRESLYHSDYKNEANASMINDVVSSRNRSQRTDAINLTVHANRPERIPGVDLDDPPLSNRKPQTAPHQKLRLIQKRLCEKGKFEQVPCESTQSLHFPSMPQRPVARRASDSTLRGSPVRFIDPSACSKDSLKFGSSRNEQSATRLKQQNLETIVCKVSDNRRRSEFSSNGTLRIVSPYHGQRYVGSVTKPVSVNAGSVISKRRSLGNEQRQQTIARKSDVVAVRAENQRPRRKERLWRNRKTQSPKCTQPLSSPIVVIDSDDEACPQIDALTNQVEIQPNSLDHVHVNKTSDLEAQASKASDLKIAQANKNCDLEDHADRVSDLEGAHANKVSDLEEVHANKASDLEEASHLELESQIVASDVVASKLPSQKHEPEFFDDLDLGSEVQIEDSSPIGSVSGGPNSEISCFATTEKSIIQTSTNELSIIETINSSLTNSAVPDRRPAVIVETIEAHQDVPVCEITVEEDDLYSAHELEITTSSPTGYDYVDPQLKVPSSVTVTVPVNGRNCGNNASQAIEVETSEEILASWQTNSDLEMINTFIAADTQVFPTSQTEISGCSMENDARGDSIEIEHEKSKPESDAVHIDISSNVEPTEVLSAEITPQNDTRSETNDVTGVRTPQTNTTLPVDAIILDTPKTSIDCNSPEKSTSPMIDDGEDVPVRPLDGELEKHSETAPFESDFNEVNVDNSSESPGGEASENCTDLKNSLYQLINSNGAIVESKEEVTNPQELDTSEGLLSVRLDDFSTPNTQGVKNPEDEVTQIDEMRYENCSEQPNSTQPEVDKEVHKNLDLGSLRIIDSLPAKESDGGYESDFINDESTVTNLSPYPSFANNSQLESHTENTANKENNNFQDPSLDTSINDTSSQISSPSEVGKNCLGNENLLNEERPLEPVAPCQVSTETSDPLVAVTEVPNILLASSDASEKVNELEIGDSVDTSKDTSVALAPDEVFQPSNDSDYQSFDNGEILLNCASSVDPVGKSVDTEHSVENDANQKELDRPELQQPTDSVADLETSDCDALAPGADQNEGLQLTNDSEHQSHDTSALIDEEPHSIYESLGGLPVNETADTMLLVENDDKREEPVSSIPITHLDSKVDPETPPKDVAAVVQNEASQCINVLEQHQSFNDTSLTDKESSLVEVSPNELPAIETPAGSELLPEENSVREKELDSSSVLVTDDLVADLTFPADASTPTQLQSIPSKESEDTKLHDKKATVENLEIRKPGENSESSNGLEVDEKTKTMEDNVVPDVVTPPAVLSNKRLDCSLVVSDPIGTVESDSASIVSKNDVLHPCKLLDDGVNDCLATKPELLSPPEPTPSPEVNHADISKALSPSPSSGGSCVASKDSPKNEITINQKSSSPPKISTEHRPRRGKKRERVVRKNVEENAYFFTKTPQVVLRKLDPEAIQRALQPQKPQVSLEKESEVTTSGDTDITYHGDPRMERGSQQLSPDAKVPKLETTFESTSTGGIGRKGQKRTIEDVVLQEQIIRKAAWQVSMLPGRSPRPATSSASVPIAAFDEPDESVVLEINSRIMEYLRKNKNQKAEQKVPYFREFTAVLPEPLRNQLSKKSDVMSSIRQLVGFNERSRSCLSRTRPPPKIPSNRESSPIEIKSDSEDSLPGDDDRTLEANEIDRKPHQNIGTRFPLLFSEPDGNPKRRATPCRTERSKELRSFSTSTTSSSLSFYSGGPSSSPTILGEPRQNLLGQQKVYVRPELTYGDHSLAESPGEGRCAMLTAATTTAAMLGTYHSAKHLSFESAPSRTSDQRTAIVSPGDDGSIVLPFPFTISQSTSEGSVHQVTRKGRTWQPGQLTAQTQLELDTTRSWTPLPNSRDVSTSENRHQVQPCQEADRSSSSLCEADDSSGDERTPKRDHRYYWNKFVACLPDDRLFNEISKLIDQPPAKKARDS